MQVADQLNRMNKIEHWIEWGFDRVADLISRKAETASLSGFDGDSRQIPCNHPIVWRRSKLCLLCSNTGWRPLADGEEGIDPYTLDVRQTKGGFTAKSAGDESMAQKRAARLKQLDHAIDRIQHTTDLREGRIGQLDAMMSNVDRISRPPHSFTKLSKALALMRETRPDYYARLPHPIALLWLSQHIPGRINEAPVLSDVG